MWISSLPNSISPPRPWCKHHKASPAPFQHPRLSPCMSGHESKCLPPPPQRLSVKPPFFRESRRKTPVSVALKENERFFGDSAVGMVSARPQASLVLSAGPGT